MKEINVILVGIGGYGEQYLSHYFSKGLPEFSKLVGAIDPFPENSRYYQRIKEAGIPIFADLESFYQYHVADLAIIVTPIHLHIPFALQALSRGSHVLLEKPLCATMEEGERLRSVAKTSGKMVSVGYQWSFSEAVGSLKRDIISGRLGRPLELRTLVLWPRKISYYRRNSWAGRIKTDSGDWVLDSPLNNAAAHFLHNMLYVLGNDDHSALVPEEFQGELYRANDIENYDTAAIEMRTKAGAIIKMYVSHAVPYEKGPQFSFRFENATVTYGDDKRIVARFLDGREKVYGDPDLEYFAKIRGTVDAIRTGGSVPCDVETALAHTYCINRIQEFPIRTFPRERIRLQKFPGDSLVWVQGLAEDYEQRYGQ